MRLRAADARQTSRFDRGLKEPRRRSTRLPGMAMVLQRVLRLCLALAFVLGVTAQLLPPSMAADQMTVSADMAGGCAGHKALCSGQTPACVDHIGCITVSALLISPTSMGVPVEWKSLEYELAPQGLAGISVKPELAPPILAA
jgi:hypothetical protein